MIHPIFRQQWCVQALAFGRDSSCDHSDATRIQSNLMTTPLPHLSSPEWSLQTPQLSHGFPTMTCLVAARRIA